METVEDVLLFETLPCALEAKAIAELLSADFPEATAIVSFSCKDESCLNSGESPKLSMPKSAREISFPFFVEKTESDGVFSLRVFFT